MADDSNKKITVMMFGNVASQWTNEIRERFPDIEIISGSESDEDFGHYGDVDVLVGWKFPRGLFSRMPNLTWIQSVAVGVEGWIDDPSLPRHVSVTNVKGLYAEPIAEYIVWALISLTRGFHRHVLNQKWGRWVQEADFGLTGKRLAIAGLGSIGQAVAARASAFGMRNLGIVRDPSAAGNESVDEIIAHTDVAKIAGEVDALVICLPLTAQTRGLFGKDFISRMRKDAIIVNVAREEITDYSCIADAVRNGKLAGAALDVFENEPLRRWNRLWRIPNVLVTPHVSAMTPGYGRQVADLIGENLGNYLEGGALRNMVDRRKGY